MIKHKNNRTALVDLLSKRTGLPRSKVNVIMTAFINTIIATVSEDDKILLRGFGTFDKKTSKSRKYRDFHTGEIKYSSTTTTPVFRPSKALIQKLNLTESNASDATEVLTSISRRHKNKQSTTKISIGQLQESTGECEVIISQPNPKQTNNLRILYLPNNGIDSFNHYPIVYTPTSDSFVKLPREGRSDIRGYKESDFYAQIKSSLPEISVSDNYHVRIPGRYRPYEPDIVIYDETLNLYIDVEIDEPYDGYSRVVTHNIEGNDSIRDVFFKESGWIVVRFTEKQVHKCPEQCIVFLRNIIDVMRNQSKPTLSIIEKEDRWNYIQAAKWEQENYREKYLGIQSFQRQIRTKKVQCLDEEEGIDAVIKRTPDVSSISKENDTHTPPYLSNHPSRFVEPVNLKESIKTDTDSLSYVKPPILSFNEDRHTYSAPGDNTGNSDRISVTTLIDQFFPRFDEESYIKKRMEETGMTEAEVRKEMAEPSERGTYLHKQIENYLTGQSYDDSMIEFHHFRSFYEEQIVRRGLIFDSAEYAIELKESNIAGTVDALFRKSNGEYVMVDWKRSKHLIIDGYAKKYGFGRGLSVLSHLDNSSYYKYELQQSFYKYILEKEYGIKVSSMILAVLYPDYDRYYSIRITEYRKQEVLDMIETYETIY